MHPVYKYLLVFTGRRGASSFISISLVLITIVLIFISLAWTFLGEATKLLDSADVILIQATDLSDNLTIFANRYLPAPVATRIGELPSQSLTWAFNILGKWVTDLISNLPILFTHLLLVLFFTYYLLVDGKSVLHRAIDPRSEKTIIYRFLYELDEIYNSLFHIYLITAGVTGAMGAILFFAMDIPYPLILGMLVALLELVPLLGSAGVLWPMVIYHFLINDYVTAVLLLVLGTIFMTVIPQNVIRPRLAMKQASIHPVITIIAYTAPIFSLGTLGVIVGPAIFGFVLAGYRTLSYLNDL
jgi:predicted PurR-regulated permease PerM